MADVILLNSDKAIFEPNFAAAKVLTPLIGSITAKGVAKTAKKRICVKGDELSVSVKGCVYMHVPPKQPPPWVPVPGTGTVSIKEFANNDEHLSKHVKSGEKPVLLKGGKFAAVLKVDMQTQYVHPTTGVIELDSTNEYEGKGQFTSCNTKTRAL